MNNQPPLSHCCNAPLTVSTADEGTSCFICTQCKKPADMKVSNPQLAWETLFDKQFSDEGIDLPDERHSSYPYFQGTQQCKDIKDFIRNLIAQTENEVYNMGYEDALQGLPRSQKNKG